MYHSKARYKLDAILNALKICIIPSTVYTVLLAVYLCSVVSNQITCYGISYRTEFIFGVICEMKIALLVALQ